MWVISPELWLKIRVSATSQELLEFCELYIYYRAFLGVIARARSLYCVLVVNTVFATRLLAPVFGHNLLV
jgi:hypothetical protein